MEEKIKIRNLKKEDRKEYLTLLSQLTKCNIYSQSKFDKLFKKIFSNKNVYIRVLSYSNKIVACGTIFIEDKFTRDTCKAGHIEEIVVLEKYKKEDWEGKL